MNDFFSSITNQDWWNYISLFLGLSGIVLGFIFYYKSKKSKKPLYNFSSNSLISDKQTLTDDLEVKYKGKIIKNLRITKFAFWNSGSEVIRKSDIASTSPLKIQIDPAFEIFNFAIIHQKHENNVSVLKITENTLQVDFDFLDMNEGFILSFYHNSEPKKRVSFSGTIIGSKINFYPEQVGRRQNAIAKITQPIDDLLKSKSFLTKVLAITLAIVVGIILLLPWLFIVQTYDNVYKTFQKVPKQFLFDD